MNNHGANPDVWSFLLVLVQYLNRLILRFIKIFLEVIARAVTSGSQSRVSPLYHMSCLKTVPPPTSKGVWPHTFSSVWEDGKSKGQVLSP